MWPPPSAAWSRTLLPGHWSPAYHQGHAVSAKAEGCHFPLCTCKAVAVLRLSMYPRNTEVTVTATAVATDMAVDKELPPAAPTLRTHIRRRHSIHIPSSFCADRGAAHMPHSQVVHKHKHVHRSLEHQHSLCLPDTSVHILSHGHHLPYLPHGYPGPAECSLQTHITHTLIPQAPHTHVPLQIPAWILHLTNSTVPSQGLLLSGWPSLEFARESTHNPCTSGLGKAQTLAPRSWHLAPRL